MPIIPHLSQTMQTLLTTTTEVIATTLAYVKRPDRANTQRVPDPQHPRPNTGLWLAGPPDCHGRAARADGRPRRRGCLAASH